MAIGELENREVLDGPFNVSQLERISDALSAAERQTGLIFSVYVGELSTATRVEAEKLHDKLSEPANSILVAVSPNQRVLEIVTGDRSRKKLSDQQCALVALSMTSSFSGGDLTGGIITGLRMLADQARK